MALSVLVVDDDPNIRQSMTIHLRAAGYDVRTAKDGIEAGYAVLRQRPDLMILDVQMPYMDGFELLAALRADEETRSIPVLMLTTEDEWGERGRKLGATAYVTKPIFADKLLTLVALHLRANNKRQAEA